MTVTDGLTEIATPRAPVGSKKCILYHLKDLIVPVGATKNIQKLIQHHAAHLRPGIKNGLVYWAIFLALSRAQGVTISIHLFVCSRALNPHFLTQVSSKSLLRSLLGISQVTFRSFSALFIGQIYFL